MPSVGDVRAVVDTNVLLSGLLWRGAPHRLLEQARAGTLTLITSPVLLAELAEVRGRAKFQAVLARSHTDAGPLLADLRLLADIFDPPPLPAAVSRDADDDAVLALALAARADMIVSGDEDLLTLHMHGGIPMILDPATALLRLSP